MWHVEPALPLEGASQSNARRQVFGLSGVFRNGSFLLSAASQPSEEPVLKMRISFLITAAGQLRIHTGFPFATFHRDGWKRTGSLFSLTHVCQLNAEMHGQRLAWF